jgi:hypothetical protein
MSALKYQYDRLDKNTKEWVDFADEELAVGCMDALRYGSSSWKQEYWGQKRAAKGKSEAEARIEQQKVESPRSPNVPF